MADAPLTPDARTRAADLFEAHADRLGSRLAARFPGTDPQRVADAVVTAVLYLSRHYERFAPKGRPLEGLLFCIARRRLQTFFRSEARRRRHEQKKFQGPVTGTARAANSLVESLDDGELVKRARAQLKLTAGEEAALDLWIGGEKDVSVYAAALGLSSRPLPEQKKEVGRVLARLRQRLHRLGVRLRREEGAE
jgi:DNA-directed RNA polymerase specialized sigma24 family protein